MIYASSRLKICKQATMDSSGESIAPPLDYTYSSYDEAYDALKSHSLDHGYGFLLHYSRPHGSNTKTLYYYRCDRYRNYKSQATKRQTGTRTAGCPFSLAISEESGQWKLQVKNSCHNHTSSLNPMAHNVHRRRTQAQKISIKLMTKAGIAPKQILTAIRQQDPSTFIAASNIWNERVAI